MLGTQGLYQLFVPETEIKSNIAKDYKLFCEHLNKNQKASYQPRFVWVQSEEGACLKNHHKLLIPGQI